MPHEKLEFPSSEGHALAARLDLPNGQIKAYALFAHCFTCGKDVRAAGRIAEALNRNGIAVLRFDFTGLGGSEGEFANTNFSSNVEDLVAAADFLASEREAPAILIGHSLGGAAVLAAASQIPSAKAVATIAAPSEPAHVAENFHAAREEIEEDGEAEVTLAGRKFRIRRQFLEDIENSKLDAAIGSLKRALLVFHAPRDEIVGIDNATRIFVAAKHPKSFVSLDDADHLLTNARNAIYVGDVLAAWAMRYLDAGDQQADGAPRPVDNGVVVEDTGRGDFQEWLVAGKHALIADEPPSVGGTDIGPTPYDLLSGALGTCTAMTMRMYARRKGLALEKTRVVVTHDRVHGEDCADPEDAKCKVDRFTRKITLTGDLSDEEHASLLRIADKCPVHRTLENDIVIETEEE